MGQALHQHRQERAPRRSPRCRRSSATGAKITRLGAASRTTRIVVDVIDNGIGLPAENRHRLLEPYVTTREKGTGLGLAIVTKIIEEHGGRIELLDAPEVAARRPGRADPRHAAAHRRRRRERRTAGQLPEVEDEH